MSEVSAYIPPSRDPADIAARLESYIERQERNARAFVEIIRDIPKIERGHVDRFLLHVKRLEHQMRCFILFLAAQLIERGLVKPAPLSLFRRGEPDPSGPSAHVRRKDREMRRLASGKVRLSPFSITTPVIEGARRRGRRAVKSIYKLMPCSIEPIDARYLLARYGRLSATLLRADVLAERLAGRALTVKLNSSASDWMPGGQPAPSEPFGPPARTGVRSNNAGLPLKPERSETSSTPQIPAQAGIHAANSSAPETSEVWIPVSTGIGGESGMHPSEARQSPTGRRANARPIGAVSAVNSREIKNTALSATHRESGACREAGGQTKMTNPLYLQSLHSIMAPEHLWESAQDVDDERDDLTWLHLSASEGVHAAGFPPGPDPRLRLPSFEQWRNKPPPAPQIRFLS